MTNIAKAENALAKAQVRYDLAAGRLAKAAAYLECRKTILDYQHKASAIERIANGSVSNCVITSPNSIANLPIAAVSAVQVTSGTPSAVKPVLVAPYETLDLAGPAPAVFKNKNDRIDWMEVNPAQCDTFEKKRAFIESHPLAQEPGPIIRAVRPRVAAAASAAQVAVSQ